MLESAVWVARPVFVTSTFRDTHAERDWLRHRVFPELEERLRKRRCHLESIDLRWGVETAETGDEGAKQLLVLKVCLQEVARSRPFLIGILGDRYGWVPPPERMEAAAREAGFDGVVAGRSVTDLEIDFGVLADSEQRRRCLFYLRDPLPYNDMPSHLVSEYRESPGSESAKRLAALKDRLERELPGRVHHYAARWEDGAVGGLEAWGQQVLEHLWAELDEETASRSKAASVSWLEAERWALEAFVEDRARGFVGREDLLSELEALAVGRETEGEVFGACLTGLDGAGKSAAFARLHRHLEREGLLLLSHATDSSPRAREIATMLERWTEELEEALAEENPSSDATETGCEARFQMLLARASETRRVVLLVDGLDRFEKTSRAQHMLWLPASWPSNARLIATALPGSASRALVDRTGVKEIGLRPLSRDEAAQIATEICSRYHRTVNPRVLATLLAKSRADGARAASNPLWLSLAVGELNLLDADDFARMQHEFVGQPEARLLQLLLRVADELPCEVEALYDWIIERAEALHGAAWTQAFLRITALGRAGWRESDLRGLLPKLSNQPWSDLEFAALRRTFRSHLVQLGSDASWSFAHRQLHVAVVRKLGRREVLELHETIANYLLSVDRRDPLHESETALHIVESGVPSMLPEYLVSDLTPGEAAGAAHAICSLLSESDRKLQANRVTQLSAALEGPSADPNRIWRLACFFVRHLAPDLERGHVTAHVGFLFDRIDQHLRELDGDQPRDPEFAKVLLGAVSFLRAFHERAGNQRKARKLRRREVALLEDQGEASDPTAPVYRFIAMAKNHESAGDFRRAEELLEKARHAADIACKEADDARLTARAKVVALDTLGDHLRRRQDYARARTLYEEALRVNASIADEQFDSVCTSDRALILGRLGNCALREGDLQQARSYYADSLDYLLRLVRENPEDLDYYRGLSVAYDKLGNVHMEEGELTAALSNYREALAWTLRLRRAAPGDAVSKHDLGIKNYRIARCLLKLGDITEARNSASKAVEVLLDLQLATTRMTGLSHDLAGCYEQLAECDLASHERTVAESHMRRALRLRRESYESLPQSPVVLEALVSTWTKLAVLVFERGQVVEANRELGALLDALQTHSEQHSSDPTLVSKLVRGSQFLKRTMEMHS